MGNKIYQEKKGKSKKEKTTQMVKNLDKTVKNNAKKQIEHVINSSSSGKKKIEEINQITGLINLKEQEKKRFIQNTLKEIKEKKETTEKLNEVMRRLG